VIKPVDKPERTMSITAVWRGLNHHWHTVLETLWPSTIEERTCAEIAHLNAELARRHQVLLRRRRRIEALRDHLARHPSPPLSARLNRLEAAYHRQLTQLDRRKHLRNDLVAGRAKVIEVIYSPGSAGD
jgi:hypothetical protein